MNELNYIKLRTSWSKYSIKRQEKNQSTCQEKVSVTPVIDTGMVTRRYKEFLQKKMDKQPIRGMSKRQEAFQGRWVWLTQEMQESNSVRQHSTLGEVANLNHAAEGLGHQSLPVDECGRWFQHLGKHFSLSSELNVCLQRGTRRNV